MVEALVEQQVSSDARPDTGPTVEQVRARARALVDLARATDRSQILRAFFTVEPGAAFERIVPAVLLRQDGFVLAAADGRGGVAGFGVTRAAPRGAEGLAALAEFCSRQAELCHEVGVAFASVPLWVTASAFDERRAPDSAWRDFPSSAAWIPAVAISAAGAMVVSAVVEAGSDASVIAASIFHARDSALAAHVEPGISVEASVALAPLESREAWCARVDVATQTIRGGELDKVVPARAARATAPPGLRFDAAATFAALRRAHPSSMAFAVRRGDAVFMGATPETLVRLHHGILETHAVAGTAPRGRTPEEDDALARELLGDAKTRREHGVVAATLRQQLGAFCRAVEVTGEPRLIKLGHVQHLETTLRGAANAPHHLLRIAAVLHPTPSVSGAPGEAARAWLRAHEALDRGWYAGPLGTFDGAGEGSLWVAIRSLLLRDDEAIAFAGAGVVGDSRAEAEWAETELKLLGAQRALRLTEAP